MSDADEHVLESFPDFEEFLRNFKGFPSVLMVLDTLAELTSLAARLKLISLISSDFVGAAFFSHFTFLGIGLDDD